MSRLQRAMEGTRGRGPCGKARYPSRGAARRGRLRMIASGSGDPSNDFRIGEYFCDTCESYHVGHDWTAELPGRCSPMTAAEVWRDRLATAR